MQKLIPSGPFRFDAEAIPVIALVHNEANILPEFLDHYRSLGRVQFFVVDDHSTDGSTDILRDATDVAVFSPVEGSNYSEDKALWRSELLDTYANERWCLVPDIDEHFVFLGADSLAEYIAQLTHEGAEAVATLMIDMYADEPLRDHFYRAADEITLIQKFNRFDGPDEYAMRHVIGEVAKTYQTPPIAFHGGSRHRLFHGRLHSDLGPLARSFLPKRLGLDQPIIRAPNLFNRLLVDKLAKTHLSGTLNITKIGLLRWRSGLQFNGGAHKLNLLLPVSESIAGFLHYPFTRGLDGIAYLAARGQHLGGAKHYKALLSNAALDQSPVFSGTRIFNTVNDLKGLLRPVPI
jgi:hypothetical protein